MSNPFDHIAHAVLTDVGRKRKNNEDAYAVFPEHGFFCVADGMGGAEDGEVASGAVVDGLTKLFAGFILDRPLALHAKTLWIAHTLNDVSDWIFQRSKSRGKSGTGTTFVGVALDPAVPGLALALHAGDSRVYRWSAAARAKKKSALEQVTVDHSVANSLGMDDERRLNPVFRNMIMRAVGLAPTVQVERTPFAVASGDWVIICSDGLSRMVSDPNIAALLEASPDPDAAVRSLVDAALVAGGKDNVTVVAMRIGELPEAFPDDRLDHSKPSLQTSSSGTPITETTPGTAITDDNPLVHTELIGSERRLMNATWLWIAVAVVTATVLLAGVIAILSKPAADVKPVPQQEEVESGEYRQSRMSQDDRPKSRGSRILENDRAGAIKPDDEADTR